MADVTLSRKTILDAETDMALACYRDHRAGLSGPAGEFYAEVAGALADDLAGQFPGAALGRVVMSAAQSLGAIRDSMRESGLEPTTAILLTIAGLAAERLDREEADRG